MIIHTYNDNTTYYNTYVNMYLKNSITLISTNLYVERMGIDI